jgi:splicing factor 3B subunit 2
MLLEETKEQPKKQLLSAKLNIPASVYALPAADPASGDLEGNPTAAPVQTEKKPEVEQVPFVKEPEVKQEEEELKPLAVASPKFVSTVPPLRKLPEPTLPVAMANRETNGDAGGKKNKKKKKKKKNRPEIWAREEAEAERRRKEEDERANDAEPEVEVEYIPEKLDLEPSDPMYRTFAKIFDAFKLQEEDEAEAIKKETEADLQTPNEELKKVPKLLEADDMIEMKDDDDDDDKPKLSKRKLKKLNRLSVAELKQLVSRPDVVEMHDVTARDPRLLVHLKATRNTVPVPRHWCFKRKYLQGKRGIEKPPFDLPDFIKKTGIMEMRAALQEKEDEKTLKSKMREKVRPKLGKIDIDYQKLHDAFFKWQTKPRMTTHGDLYYEGKEFEIRLKEKKPGDLTDDLRTALGMPVGPNAHKVPPPWLIAMQRYGPPPSYPNLKIPGLNAPIPEGCSFGYHAGGWGKPPVDEGGKPLYGDVFGTSDSAYNMNIAPEEIDTTLWGEMESESEEEEDSDSEEEDEEGDGEGEVGEADGTQTPAVDAGLNTPSGMSSVGMAAAAMGGETPELLELRKKRIEAEMEAGGETPNLYTVLPEKRNDRVGAAGMMGSTHTYDLTKAKAGTASSAFDSGGIELALNPEEVDLMDTDAMQARAEAALREQQASLAKEDLSDMVAEHAAKQSNKRKRMAAKDDGGGAKDKSAKKYKEFKF